MIKALYETMTRTREGWSPPPRQPDIQAISFVKGSPLSKHDLKKCFVEDAYAVVLVGDRDDQSLGSK